MKMMATLAALAVLFWSTKAQAQTLEIKPTGVTGVGINGKFDFELKSPGAKKLALLNPILKVYYKGIEVPDTGYSSNITDRLKGRITITDQVIPKGKAIVKLKVKLDDGSEKTAEVEVDFKDPEPEPLPDPVPLPGGGS